jgi:probable HAF family extracellular repeat protein
MNSQKWTNTMALTLLAALAIPVQVAAQSEGKEDHPHQYHHYQLIDVGTFGGPDSSNAWAGIGNRLMNSPGAVIGQAETSTTDPYCLMSPFSCFLGHAFRWKDGVRSGLGGLPGDANGTYASSINSRGWISGVSGNGVIDPVTGYPEMFAVIWKHGKIINLGSLGGNQSAAFGINSRGEVVGAALNTTPDSFSTGFPAPPCSGSSICISESYPALFFPAATQERAVLWQNGAIKDLGTLGGPDSVAWQINESGEIAGQSYINSIPNATTGVPTIDPFFIGEDGKMVDLGNPLGGTITWTTGLNNRGEVIGAMTLAGDGGWHPFLWSKGIVTDLGLGTLGGDYGLANAINDAGDVVGVACSPTQCFAILWRDGVTTNLGVIASDPGSEAYGINSLGQIVGESFGNGIVLGHAWLWENNGPMIDLNTLIPPGSGIQLTHSVSINDRGEISGDGVLPSGNHHAFVLIPCDENHPGIEGCDYSMVDVAAGTRRSPALFVTPAPRIPTLTGPSKAIRKRLPYPGPAKGETLNGFCLQPSNHGPGCMVTSDPVHCPVGQPAKNPGITSCGENGPTYVDSASRCAYKRGAPTGECEVNRP